MFSNPQVHCSANNICKEFILFSDERLFLHRLDICSIEAYGLFFAWGYIHSIALVISKCQNFKVWIRLRDFLEPLVACPTWFEWIHVLKWIFEREEEDWIPNIKQGGWKIKSWLLLPGGAARALSVFSHLHPYCLVIFFGRGKYVVLA